jgi:hypothetical protein
MARWGNGSTEGLLIEAAPAPSPSFSMGCWFLPEQENAIGTLMAVCRSDSASGFFGLRVRGSSAGDPLEAIQVPNTGGGGASATAGPVQFGRWQYGLGVFNANNHRAVYLDSTAGTNSTNLGATTPDRLSLLYSARGARPQHYLPGAIAHAAVWSAALTAREAAALASGASPLSIRPEHLVAYWPLEGLNRREEIGVVAARALVASGTSWAPGPLLAQPPASGLNLSFAEANPLCWHDGRIGQPLPQARRPARWYPGLRRDRRRR